MPGSDHAAQIPYLPSATSPGMFVLFDPVFLMSVYSCPCMAVRFAVGSRLHLMSSCPGQVHGYVE
jgi:hypothetical protein